MAMFENITRENQQTKVRFISELYLYLQSHYYEDYREKDNFKD